MFKQSCCNTQTYLLLTLKMDYMQGSVGCSSDSPPNTDILKFWAKKQAVSTTINLTDSFKLQYTLLHAGTCGRSEWLVVEWLYREGTSVRWMKWTEFAALFILSCPVAADQNNSNVIGSRLDTAPLICRFPLNRWQLILINITIARACFLWGELYETKLVPNHTHVHE